MPPLRTSDRWLPASTMPPCHHTRASVHCFLGWAQVRHAAAVWGRGSVAQLAAALVLRLMVAAGGGSGAVWLRRRLTMSMTRISSALRTVTSLRAHPSRLEAVPGLGSLCVMIAIETRWRPCRPHSCGAHDVDRARLTGGRLHVTVLTFHPREVAPSRAVAGGQGGGVERLWAMTMQERVVCFMARSRASCTRASLWASSALVACAAPPRPPLTTGWLPHDAVVVRRCLRLHGRKHQASLLQRSAWS